MDPDASRRHNPLKEYFGWFIEQCSQQYLSLLPIDEDLGLQSASDDGEMDEEDCEDGDTAGEHESEPDQPVILRTITAFIKASKERTPITRPIHSQTPVDDDSVTGKYILDTSQL